MAARILIIDDDPVILHALESILTDNGYDVIRAENGQEGVDLLDKENVDLIILDVHMPTMNGYSFVFEIKKIDGAADVPLIVLTSKEEMEEIFKAEGVRDYLVKPINNDTLLDTVRKYI